ncbi:MAG: site-specific DNA-methyltransferase [Clostridia bacterium]
MLRKGSAKDINDMTSRNILDIPNIKAGTKIHTCQKPVELMKILIENSSSEGDVVCDMFMGSGSTGIACVESNRRFLGCEIEESTYKLAEERIREAA